MTLLRLAPGASFYALLALAFAAGRLQPLLGPITASWVAGLPGFVALLLMPGYLLDRAAGMHTLLGAHHLERVPRAFTISVGLIGFWGMGAEIIGYSIADVVVAVMVTVTLYAFLPAGLGRPALDPESLESDAKRPPLRPPVWPRWTAAAILAAMAVVAVMAAGGENVARDRMWYLAYVTRLPQGENVSWADPFFGTPYWPSRFTANAWLVALAAWKSTANLPGIFFFERVLPVLLSPVAVLAWLGLARSVFMSPTRAVAGMFACLAVLLTTTFPFFSPVDYGFFNRVGEDKFVAYFILYPTLISMLIDYVFSRRRATPLAPVAIGFSAIGISLTHGIVYLLVLLASVASLAWIALSRARPRWFRVAVCAGMLVAAALPAYRFGMNAVSYSKPQHAPLRMLREQQTHPVVRSHLRMGRLIDFQPGGPIVDPSLLAQPVLLASLAGLLVAAARRRQTWAGLLLAWSLPGLALCFLPFLTSVFSSYVFPWMIYRALWLVPFGLLLAALFLEGPALILGAAAPTAWRRGPAIALAALLGLAGLGNVEWERFDPRRIVALNTQLGIDESTRELLAEITKLPSWSLIMTGGGLSELIPAYTGRWVAGIGDRGTTVFVGGRWSAQARLRSQAAVMGLRGGNLGWRNQHIATLYATHTVWEDADCDRRSTEIFRNRRYTLCAERSPRSRVAAMPRIRAAASAEPSGRLVARIGEGLECTPPPQLVRKDGRRSWRRESRWSGKQIALDCRASFPQTLSDGYVRIVLDLPRSDESLVYRIRTKTVEGRMRRRHGAIDFRGNPHGEIRLPADNVRTLSMRLSPALLPYLHVKALEVRTRGGS